MLSAPNSLYKPLPYPTKLKVHHSAYNCMNAFEVNHDIVHIIEQIAEMKKVSLCWEVEEAEIDQQLHYADSMKR